MKTLVSLLAILGIGAVGYFFATGGANEQFQNHSIIVNSHALLGGVYLLLAPLQFSQKFRSRFLGFHRISGRVLITLGLIVGCSALFMGIVIPYSGFAEQLIIGFFGALFLASLLVSYVAIRRKDVSQHREWMIRAFAIGLSIATMRLIFVPGLLLFSLSRQQTEIWSIVSFALAFIIHCLVAELWIRKTNNSAAHQLKNQAAVL